MSSQHEEKTNKTKAGEVCCMNHEDSMPRATLSPLDRYTALRNHRIRFEDALDPNAERVTILRKYDIIFGRGKNLQDYPGNKRMRSVINKYKKLYHSIQRSEKRGLIESVYKELVGGGARFLTKASNDEHFVVVDIEVALQKVGNALRCRKKWNKAVRSKCDSGEKAGASSAVSQNRAVDIAIHPAAISQDQTIRRESYRAPLALNRSQTMILLRTNTVRLMKKMPLLPATVNDMYYLQHCQSLQQPLGQFTLMRAPMQMNSGVSGSLPVGWPGMAGSMERRSAHEFSGTAVDCIGTSRK